MIHPANTTSTTLLPTNPKAPEVYSKSISNPTANTSQASTTSIYTQDIETAIGVIRESFVHLIKSKDNDIQTLQSQLHSKEAETREWIHQCHQLETQLERSKSKIQELSVHLKKLNLFKQQIYNSLIEEHTTTLLSTTTAPNAASKIEVKKVNLPLQQQEQKYYGETKEAQRKKEHHLQDSFTTSLNRSGTIESSTHEVSTQSPSLFPSTLASTPKLAKSTHSNGSQILDLLEQTDGAQSSSFSLSASQESEASCSSKPQAWDSLLPSFTSTNLTTTTTTTTKTTASASMTNDSEINEERCVVDGREFFKTARSLLTYDEFSDLLDQVQKFNARHQSRQTTLNYLYTTLGHQYPTLIKQFEKILNTPSSSSSHIG